MPDVPGGNRGEVKSFPIKNGAYNTADGADPGVYPGANVIRISGFDGKPAKFFPDGRVKYEANGRRAGAELCIVQWQKGRPVAVHPESIAAAKATWPKS